MKKKVVVGLSGGVDSSVAALLLKEQGYEVIGVFMKNWEESNEQSECSSKQDYEDVVSVCETLKIPYFSLNFVQEYQDHVFSHFLEELKQGYTPNPDILCNREIKFKRFFQKALELGANFLATGHYAQTDHHHLLRSVDKEKDQTYFLYTLSSSILEKVLFPIGHLTKQEVRKIAEENGLITAKKKDSTGIGFIGERKFSHFLKGYIAYQPGNFKTLKEEIVGKHQGVAYYTLGQRKGLGIGGKKGAKEEAWCVVKKDVKNNVVYVEQGEDHPALYRNSLFAEELSWISGHAPNFPFSCTCKIRYRQEDQECCIEKEESGKIFVSFSKPQRAITPRQSIVFYTQEKCLGGGTICP